MTNQVLLKKIEREIQNAPTQVQGRLLTDLPRLLNISIADLTLARVAEKSFDFWNNPDDQIYDAL